MLVHCVHLESKMTHWTLMLNAYGMCITHLWHSSDGSSALYVYVMAQRCCDASSADAGLKLYDKG